MALEYQKTYSDNTRITSMPNTVTKYGPRGAVEVECRSSMEPSDLEPDDARKLIEDIMSGVYKRMLEMDDSSYYDLNEFPADDMPSSERAKQYYGNDTYQLLSGIEAALREWDESGDDVQELKEKYSGRFVDGVEIGERLAVYQGSDFTFSE